MIDNSPPSSLREPGSAAPGMVCPVCKVVLVMADRQGIEIDYCPKCRGVWLDRGELDKIIERSVGASSPPPAPAADMAAQPGYPPRGSQNSGHDGYQESSRHGSGHGYSSQSHGSKHRRRSWLGDLFD